MFNVPVFKSPLVMKRRNRASRLLNTDPVDVRRFNRARRLLLLVDPHANVSWWRERCTWKQLQKSMPENCERGSRR